MPLIERILVPVDLGDDTEPLVEHAASWASRLGASVTLFHVWNPSWWQEPDVRRSPGEPTGLETEIKQEAGARLAEIASGLASSAHVTCAHRVVIGHPAREIVRQAADGHADLILMGTHARKGVARLVLGSVAEKVVQMASCAVVTVRLEPPPIRYPVVIV